MTRRTLLVVVAFLVLCPAVGFADDYQVVVNNANATEIIYRDVLGKMFLKKIVKWDTGEQIVPVDQPPTSAVRAAFTKTVHAKPLSAIASYWQQQIFAGREVPPAEKAGDAAVVAFVKANPGAIGYVSGNASTAGVKRVNIR